LKALLTISRYELTARIDPPRTLALVFIKLLFRDLKIECSMKSAPPWL